MHVNGVKIVNDHKLNSLKIFYRFASIINVK